MTGEQDRRKALLRETFDAVAAGYDDDALRFFPDSANLLVASLSLRGTESVLDVATGTGHAAIALAGRVPKGWVTGVDFSRGMLDEARRKAALLKLENVTFLERDMQDLGLPPGAFDTAVCSFGIFFSEDMDAQLAHIAAAVRPVGTIAIASFQETYFQPLRDRLFARLADHGVASPPQTWKRIATEEGCRGLFADAGLHAIRMERRNVGYYLASAELRWNVVWNAGFRRLVAQVRPEELERFRRSCMNDAAALATKDGIWLDVGVLFTYGTRT